MNDGTVILLLWAVVTVVALYPRKKPYEKKQPSKPYRTPKPVGGASVMVGVFLMLATMVSAFFFVGLWIWSALT